MYGMPFPLQFTTVLFIGVCVFPAIAPVTEGFTMSMDHPSYNRIYSTLGNQAECNTMPSSITRRVRAKHPTYHDGEGGLISGYRSLDLPAHRSPGAFEGVGLDASC